MDYPSLARPTRSLIYRSSLESGHAEPLHPQGRNHLSNRHPRSVPVLIDVADLAVVEEFVAATRPSRTSDLFVALPEDVMAPEEENESFFEGWRKRGMRT